MRSPLGFTATLCYCNQTTRAIIYALDVYIMVWKLKHRLLCMLQTLMVLWGRHGNRNTWGRACLLLPHDLPYFAIQIRSSHIQIFIAQMERDEPWGYGKYLFACLSLSKCSMSFSHSFYFHRRNDMAWIPSRPGKPLLLCNPVHIREVSCGEREPFTLQ